MIIKERIDRTITTDCWKIEFCVLVTDIGFLTVEKKTWCHPIKCGFTYEYHSPWGYMFTEEDFPMETLIKDSLRDDGPSLDWEHD